MTPEQFAALLDQLLSAFAPWITVWLMLFVVGGVLAALMVPVTMIARKFIENSWSS